MDGLRRGIRVLSVAALVLFALGLALNFLTASLICFSRCPSPEGYADQAVRYALVLLGPGTALAALVWTLWFALLARRRAWLAGACVLLAVPLLAVPLAAFAQAGAPWTGYTSIDDPLDPVTQGLPGRLSILGLCTAGAMIVSFAASRRRQRLQGEALADFLSDGG
jgi:hypothetical protein